MNTFAGSTVTLLFAAFEHGQRWRAVSRRSFTHCRALSPIWHDCDGDRFFVRQFCHCQVFHNREPVAAVSFDQFCVTTRSPPPVDFGWLVSPQPGTSVALGAGSEDPDRLPAFGAFGTGAQPQLAADGWQERRRQITLPRTCQWYDHETPAFRWLTKVESC